MVQKNSSVTELGNKSLPPPQHLGIQAPMFYGFQRSPVVSLLSLNIQKRPLFFPGLIQPMTKSPSVTGRGQDGASYTIAGHA